MKLKHLLVFQDAFWKPAQASRDAEMVEVMKWAFVVTNRFFRLLYGQGIWIPLELAKTAVRDGFWMVDAGMHAFLFLASATV